MKYFLSPLLLCSIILFTGCGTTTVDAEHTGYITAVEKNGTIWKTGKVYIKTDLSSSQEDYYCVENQDIYNSLKEKAKNKEKVTVVYHSEFFVAPWRCGSEPAIIDSIK